MAIKQLIILAILITPLTAFAQEVYPGHYFSQEQAQDAAQLNAMYQSEATVRMQAETDNAAMQAQQAQMELQSQQDVIDAHRAVYGER